MSGNVTLVSTDPQDVVDKVLQSSVANEEATFGEVAENSDETAAESQTAEVEKQEEQRPSKRKHKQKRLAEKLTEAEKKIAEYERRLESRGSEQQAPEKTQQADPFAYPVPKPKAQDFADPQEAIEAIANWTADAREYKKAREAEVEARQEVVQSHFDRVDEAREKHEDFDEVMEQAETQRFLNDAAKEAFFATIYENEDGPEVLYYLAKHPEVQDSLAQMKPWELAAKIGRIASSLTSPEPQKKPAPRLINPVGGGSKRADAPADRSNLSHAEWKRLRQAGEIR